MHYLLCKEPTTTTPAKSCKLLYIIVSFFHCYAFKILLGLTFRFLHSRGCKVDSIFWNLAPLKKRKRKEKTKKKDWYEGIKTTYFHITPMEGSNSQKSHQFSILIVKKSKRDWKKRVRYAHGHNLGILYTEKRTLYTRLFQARKPFQSPCFWASQLKPNYQTWPNKRPLLFIFSESVIVIVRTRRVGKSNKIIQPMPLFNYCCRLVGKMCSMTKLTQDFELTAK